MNHNLTTAVLAIGGDKAKSGADAFWNTSAGGLLATLMGIVGILVVIVAVMKCFSKVTNGKAGEAVKIALGAALFAAFLFNPDLITQMIGVFSDIIGKVVGSFSDVVDKSGNGSGQ